MEGGSGHGVDRVLALNLGNEFIEQRCSVLYFIKVRAALRAAALAALEAAFEGKAKAAIIREQLRRHAKFVRLSFASRCSIRMEEQPWSETDDDIVRILS